MKGSDQKHTHTGRAATVQLEALDGFIAGVLVLGYVGWLLATARSLGYARDEGFYFQAAQSYERWFQLLISQPTAAFARENVDRFWVVNHEHPALMKSLSALSHHLFHAKWGWFSEAGTAYRFPGMVVSSLSLAITFLWGRLTMGRGAGLMAAFFLALMPRVFFHSHLNCFDVPVTTMWLLASFVYWLSLERGGVSWALLAGVTYGLLLETKHNSWLLPPALVLHFVAVRWRELSRELPTGRVRLPSAWVAMAVLGPALFIAAWPWLWFDTVGRFAEYAKFHLGHEYYNMEFLGQTYWKPPMPRLYPWLMTAATVPGITLATAAAGFAAAARGMLDQVRGRPSEPASSTQLLWVVCAVAAYSPWLSTNAPIFGGTKHWMSAYPYLALFAGAGFMALWRAARRSLARLRPCPLICDRAGKVRRWPAVGLAAALLAGPLVMTSSSHPWGLSFYTPLVGGAPGAATLGLNRTFWGYTIGAVEEYLNQYAPANARLYVHDTALQSFAMMVRDGRVRPDIRGTLEPHASNVALYHHEQHMSRVEHQLWVTYGTTAPVHVGTFQGVPVVWVYARPDTAAAR